MHMHIMSSQTKHDLMAMQNKDEPKTVPTQRLCIIILASSEEKNLAYLYTTTVPNNVLNISSFLLICCSNDVDTLNTPPNVPKKAALLHIDVRDDNGGEGLKTDALSMHIMYMSQIDTRALLIERRQNTHMHTYLKCLETELQDPNRIQIIQHVKIPLLRMTNTLIKKVGLPLFAYQTSYLLSIGCLTLTKDYSRFAH